MRNFTTLISEHILNWVGMEMALSEGSESTPVIWNHASVPFKQFIRLDLFLDDGSVLSLLSQGDDGSGWFGIYSKNNNAEFLKPASYEMGSIYRTRDVVEFPKGEVSMVNETVDSAGNVLELSLGIGGATVRIVSGEVYEKDDGSYCMTAVDESLLIQLIIGS